MGQFGAAVSVGDEMWNMFSFGMSPKCISSHCRRLGSVWSARVGLALVPDRSSTCPRDIICHVPPLFSLRVCIWRGFKTKYDVCHVLCEEFFTLDHGRNFVGDTGEVSPRFFRWGGYNMPCPPTFSLRFCIWRNSKNKSDVGHVLRETFFTLNVTHSQVDVET